MQIYGSNILTLDFTNNFAMVNGEDYCVDKDLTPNRTSVFGQYGGPLTFSRGSHAMMTDKTGRLTYAPNNLLTYSQTFNNSAWAWVAPNATITLTTATAAPDGTATAYKIIEDTTLNNHRVIQGLTIGDNQQIVFSAYVKAAERNTISLSFRNKANVITSYFYYLATGTCDAGGTITPVGNGWYRISLTANASIGATSTYVAILLTTGSTANYTGDGTSGIFIWGAQLEAVTYQTTPRAYIPTTTTAYYGPRFDYDPLTLSNKGLLIEETRSNLLTYSEQFDNAAWTKSGITISANVTTSPDGTVDADKLVEDSSAGTHSATSTAVSKSAVATTYTYSLYAKAAERSALQMRIADGSNSANRVICDANLATQTVSTSVGGTFTNASATITHVGNGWFRITLTGTSSTETSIFAHAFLANPAGTISYTGTVGSGLYIWGAQLEVGAFATSYIPTVASTVTRNFDNCSIVGSNFAGWYNQQQGSFVCNADSNANISTNVYCPFSVSDGTLPNHIRGYIYNGRWGASCTFENSFQFDLNQAGSYVPNVPAKLVVSYNNNDFAISVNGASTLTDTSGIVPVFDRLNIGSRLPSFNHLNGHIRSIQYYPQRLPNATLQSLTAPPATTTLSLDFINQAYTVGA